MVVFFFFSPFLPPHFFSCAQVFVLKFHTIARYQLSLIFKKCKPQSELGAAEAALPGVPTAANTAPVPVPSPAPATPVAPAPVPVFEKQGEKEKEDKQTFQVTDCRSLVKTLVCGVKTITWGITSCKAPGGNTVLIISIFSFTFAYLIKVKVAYSTLLFFFFIEAQFIPNKQLQPKETQIYIKLVKYAMQALDIYQVCSMTRATSLWCFCVCKFCALYVHWNIFLIHLKKKNPCRLLYYGQHFGGIFYFRFVSTQEFHEQKCLQSASGFARIKSSV